MADISAIAGTLLGFIVAFVADPIKNSILNLINVRLLRKAIYCELISIYDRACTFVNEKSSLYSRLDTSHLKTISDVIELFVQRDKQAFFYAKEQQPLLFYRLDESILLSVVFSEMDYYQKLERDHVQDSASIELKLIEYASLFKDSLERLFRHKEFDQQLLLNLAQGLRCQKMLRAALGK